MGFLETIKSTLDNLPSYNEVNLVQAVQSLNLTFNEVSKYVTEPKDLEYGRNVIYRSENVEVIVIHLPSMAKTLIHDHGISIGCIFVVAGDFLNVLYKLEDKASYPIYDQVEEFTQHEILVVKEDTIHMMYNPTTSPVITFHIYTPPLKGGTTYPSP
ncbi:MULTISPECIES: cysteine dioxygenase [Peribacillus]|uniref:Cysteine dioxygenase family protein n=1 Tax=Peribacillus castrilensis TaxID=2897690 RepID=A0AAW9N5D2_9BACI|nr:cysteine dioxygenase family protein [Peribacillus frigoritolerans]MEC0272091.1 cysteine dioxygenase family protein [Peribacillus castrilensis]MEC0346580.1 cysteine dioxygenase family protein [Peribacillus castrilensis]TFH61504.1 cysteine dioxygenase [Peribacillus frigoritolerans]